MDPQNTDLPPIQQPQPSDQTGVVQANAQDPMAQFASSQPIGSQKLAQMVVSLPEEAADTDLIEKEWVLKAKQIVEHTADDPYTQQAELNKVKADYMKKRYNKNIKLSES